MQWTEPKLINDKWWYIEIYNAARLYGRVSWEAREDSENNPMLYNPSISYPSINGIMPSLPSCYSLSRAQYVVEKALTMSREDAIKYYGAKTLRFVQKGPFTEIENIN